MSTIDLYAVLGVAADASTDEIRAAWKRAVADLDPTDPKLNVFNQAGAVLLDDERRARYDAEVAAAAADADDAPEGGAPEDREVSSGPSEPTPTPMPTRDAAVAQPVPTMPVDAAGQQAPREVSTGLLALVGALVVAAVLAAIFAAGPIGRALPDRGVPASEQRLGDAVSAAEKAAVPVLSYDYRHMAQDEKAATAQMTPAFAKRFESLFALIEQNAPATQSVVTVQVIGSALAASTADTVDVLLFVNRPTTKKGQSEPVVYKDFVTLTMREKGGRWLVDSLKAAPPA
ncbi:J domain-containing protein [Nocardioides jiangxiensis]|uniref:J domain-containing protein n=1 Tax=Nocardioides jiangxiensis TaxID=3064524 RepID=A0ABT9AYR5_9ACTN|nr:hypothetical protein [Nocardioides sp. WY-20]MDO7867726.1 hypothetical protein [Nocardioides sp. WY-20]